MKISALIHEKVRKNRIVAGSVLAVFLVTCITGCDSSRQKSMGDKLTDPDETTIATDLASSDDTSTTTTFDEEQCVFPRILSRESSMYEVYEISWDIYSRAREKAKGLTANTEDGYEWNTEWVGYHITKDYIFGFCRLIKQQTGYMGPHGEDALMYCQKMDYSSQLITEYETPLTFSEFVRSGANTIIAREYTYDFADPAQSIATFYEINLSDYSIKELFSLKMDKIPDLECYTGERIYFTKADGSGYGEDRQTLYCYDLSGEELFSAQAPADAYETTCKWFILDNKPQVFYGSNIDAYRYASVDEQGNMINNSDASPLEAQRDYIQFGNRLILSDEDGLWNMDNGTLTWDPIVKWEDVPQFFTDEYITTWRIYDISQDEETILLNHHHFDLAIDYSLERILLLVRKQ